MRYITLISKDNFEVAAPSDNEHPMMSSRTHFPVHYREMAGYRDELYQPQEATPK